MPSMFLYLIQCLVFEYGALRETWKIASELPHLRGIPRIPKSRDLQTRTGVPVTPDAVNFSLGYIPKVTKSKAHDYPFPSTTVPILVTNAYINRAITLSNYAANLAILIVFNSVGSM